MSTHSTATARAVQWEVDDAAPTRIRWEQVKETPSMLEATRVWKQEDVVDTQRDFPDFADDVNSDVATRIRLFPGRGALARMSSSPETTGDHPFLLARRANKNGSAPSLPDLSPTDSDMGRDSWIPDEPPESGPRLIQHAPPAHAWVEPPTVVASPQQMFAPRALPAPVFAPLITEPPPAIVVSAIPKRSSLRTLFISMWAFAITLALVTGFAVRYMAAVL